MNDKIDPKVVMDLSLFCKIGGWNNYIPATSNVGSIFGRK